MANYGHIIFYSLVGGVFSLIGGILLLSSKKTAQKLTLYGTPFAGGALLAAVFLDLFKDGVEESSPDGLFLGALLGVVIFFLAEGFLHWFHHHHKGEDKQDATIPLIIAGDTIHNAMDGVAIAAAFLVSIPTGIVTTFAVAAHEIPQEIGDFGLMLSKGMKRAKVIWVNVFSALATTVMAVITFALGSQEALPVGLLLGISAGFLLYIAVSDVIPTIHEHSKGKHSPFDLQTLLLILGIVTVALSIQLAHRIAPEAHDEPVTPTSSVHSE
jgi:zinc and cadmium transporter